MTIDAARKKAIEFWDSIGATTQHQDYQTDTIKCFHRAEAKAVLAGLSPGMTVLECGCGKGRFIDELASSGQNLSVVGIDNGKTLTKEAAERFSGVRSVVILRADAPTLPFADGCFDAIVLAFNTFGIIPEPLDKTVLAELCRVLKTGGRIFISVFRDSKTTQTEQLKLYQFASLEVGSVEKDRIVFAGGGISRRFSEDQLKAYFSGAGDFTLDVRPFAEIGLLLEAVKNH